jgi:hypothetical protein
MPEQEQEDDVRTDGGRSAGNPETRLGEARKQLRIVLRDVEFEDEAAEYVECAVACAESAAVCLEDEDVDEADEALDEQEDELVQEAAELLKKAAWEEMERNGYDSGDFDALRGCKQSVIKEVKNEVFDAYGY